MIGWTLEQPAAYAVVVKSHVGIVAGGNALGANLLRHNQKLIKLQMIVAEAAGDGRAAGKILLDERAHHVALKALLVIDHVVRDAEVSATRRAS